MPARLRLPLLSLSGLLHWLSTEAPLALCAHVQVLHDIEYCDGSDDDWESCSEAKSDSNEGGHGRVYCISQEKKSRSKTVEKFETKEEVALEPEPKQEPKPAEAPKKVVINVKLKGDRE